MIPRIKVSALALLALAAIGTASASAAQAAGEFTADEYPATITGAQLGNHVFKFEGPVITCPTATFHGELPAPSSELTLDAEYGECKTNNGNAAVVEMTSCDYQFHAGETLAMDKVDGSLDIECAEAGDRIDFVVPSSGCKFEIGAQNGLNSLVYTDNTMAEDFDVDIALNGVLFKQNSKCPGGEKMGFAEYDGKSTMQADFEEEKIGTTVD
jgi:uncharacterized protein YaiE (UPF0345 family)